MSSNNENTLDDILELDVEIKRAIKRLNNHTSVKLQFIDLRKLQLRRPDPYSYLSESSLRIYIDQEILSKVFIKRWPRSFQINCLRWIARGLDPKLAIAKVELDMVARTYRLI